MQRDSQKKQAQHEKTVVNGLQDLLVAQRNQLSDWKGKLDPAESSAQQRKNAEQSRNPEVELLSNLQNSLEAKHQQQLRNYNTVEPPEKQAEKLIGELEDQILHVPFVTRSHSKNFL